MHMYEVQVSKYDVSDTESQKYEAEFDWRLEITYEVAINNYRVEHIVATVLYVFYRIAHNTDDDVGEYPYSQVKHVPVYLNECDITSGIISKTRVRW
jgi:hypothetical protein